MLLSIMICRLKGRKKSYERLRDILNPQLNEKIEVLHLEDDGKISVGVKRNSLMIKASGEYICYIDDDDRISPDYVEEVMNGIELGVDCCSLVGEITFDGKDPKMFVHSIDYDTYFEKNGVYYRPPNHLNVIRKSIAKKFYFPPIDHGEDTDWAMQIANSQFLKNEHKVKKTIYYYDYVQNKN